MKKVLLFLKNRYHIAAIGFLLIFLYSLIILFTYRFRELPDSLPHTIVKTIEQSSYQGMPLFTASQFFDHLIKKYPQFDIRAAGNKPWKQTETLHSFLLLTLDDDVAHFGDRKNLTIQKLQEDSGVYLFLLTQKSGKRILLLSSMIEKLKVSSSYHPKGSPFKLGVHKTGYKSWMYVGLLTENFNEKMHEGVWAHPLNKKGTFITIITPLMATATQITFQSGITDTGKCKHCSPVIATIVQGEHTQKINAPEGDWKTVPLKGFNPKKPLTITITTEKPGRRHYCFNIAYTMKK
ncbi:hypothetical protein KAH37_03750 [bacterium]|nr:hypothetical protein [bacterium]